MSPTTVRCRAELAKRLNPRLFHAERTCKMSPPHSTSASHSSLSIIMCCALIAAPQSISKDGLGEGVGHSLEELTARYEDVDRVLWPCLPDAPKTKAFYESTSFKKYVAVNQRFADAIVSMYAEGDKIQAFKAFLDKYPEYQGKVVLIQVALQTTEENKIQGGVADDLTFSQYLALLTVADAGHCSTRPRPPIPQLRAPRPDLAAISPAISPAAAYVHLQEGAQAATRASSSSMRRY
ncbi:hypothetical protein A0H81_08907 [Grifola frondosa]|uniref:Uncharacterized protein n=1 Tax=Grifola frondosa TaxID=5627 RepID=A0A1C7M547_GRIFR|nr:hypothetical protein A0H81_08907 [Grifola frondosa]